MSGLNAIEAELRLHEAALELIESTPGARNLEDVERITGIDWRKLLAEVSGLSLESVRHVMTDEPRFGLGAGTLVSSELIAPISEWHRLTCRCETTERWWFAPLGDRHGVIGCDACKSLDLIDTWGPSEVTS